jgi:RNA polymerase sigma factor (sigma-70 family)
MDADTQIGGMNARFPDTHHSAIVAAGSHDAARRSIGYEAIIAAYWKPVYRYIRVKWRRSNEDAKDLTQGFFALALEKRYFQKYEAGEGTFRTYLRTCLDRHLANAHKFETRQKRRAEMVPLDFDVAESIFEREWARGLFETAVDRLRESLHARGRETCFAVFERYDLAEEPASYDQLAREFGISGATVTNYLAAARRELRKLVLEQLRAVTPDEREFQREARALLK